jgi:hypothetical protein
LGQLRSDLSFLSRGIAVLPVQELQAFDAAGVTFRLLLDSGEGQRVIFRHGRIPTASGGNGCYLEATEHARGVVTARSQGSG